MTKFDLNKDLYQYQVEDASKMLNGGNYLNLSEMGIGKTPITLKVIEDGKYSLPLIVCPNSLRLEWKRQIEEWVGPNMAAVSTSDSYTKLAPIVNSFKDGQKYRIINYETLRNRPNLELLSYIPFDIIVFDEIHKCRNPKTKLVPSVWEFLNNQPKAKVIGLSGSPIMNYPNDLYIPLSIINPKEYYQTK